jgi:SNF2 family DNA or RNA helicase
MSNWKNEAARFTPDLNVLILQGPDRKQYFSEIENYDIILTTYPLMNRDKALYEKLEFHYLILDEAQAIKNAKTKTTQLIYAIKARHRLCVTGTPMENHLGEIWSMYHFLMPGYLGTQQKFNSLFRKPIEQHADDTRGQVLRARIEPFLLRRTKDVVADELPEKTEMIRTVTLSGKQRDLYETVRVAMDKKVRDEIKKKGLARSHIMILDALLKLRQVCCDPQLVKLEKARNVKESAKLDLLMTMIPEMVEEGRKILLFSQFTSMLSIIEKNLKKSKIKYTKLTGQTRKRAEAIEAFQEGDAKVFLISLKAGGVGLNLTAADVVIHYDPWWNPAVERQATDRAHRIGQDKPVFVYKLITEETVEEKIIKMQEKKQALADALYAKKGKAEASFDQSDLMDLLKPLG